jgi:cephalosporin-C deacetylase-like acetyl esterase
MRGSVHNAGMSKSRQLRWSWGLLIACALALSATAQEIVTTPAKPTGIYGVGEPIEWKVELKNAGDVKEVAYVLKKGGLTVTKQGTLDVSAGPATLKTSLDEPGTMLVELRVKQQGGKEVRALAGAAAAPEKILPSAPPPDDFDAFWTAKIAQLEAIPPNPQLEPTDGGKAGVDYFKLQLDNINNSHVYGQIAKPQKEGKFPAVLIVQYAGVYGLPKTNVTNRAAAGWLALNIMAHDLPFDQPEDFYKQASQTTLKDYMSIGDEDRDTSYFLRMYLGCYRAVEYLASRPDWDGKTLVVMGTSQGGQQSIVTAGLNPRITAMMANVPAGCDVTGFRIGRASGFPYWSNQARTKKNDKIVEVGRYFDAVNFAARIKCPAMVSMGLLDETCPPSGVLAAVNQMKGPKQALILLNSNHHGDHNAQAEYFSKSEAWARRLAKGDAELK